MAGKKVIAARSINNATTRLPRHVEDSLEGGGIVRLAVTVSPEIADRERIRILRGGGCQRGANDQPPNDFGPQSCPFHKCVGAVDALDSVYLRVKEEIGVPIG